MKKYKKDKGASEPFVGIAWSMMDSAAWKCLSTDSTWLYSQMLRRWRGGRFVLPFADVRWKMTWPTFNRARKELLDLGFIVLLERHGLDGKANVYGPSDKWKAVSRALLSDRTAGRIVKRLRRVNGESRMVSEWEPTQKHPEAYLASRRSGLQAANAAKRKKRGNESPDGRTSSGRVSKRELTSQSPDKHVIGSA